MTKQSTYNLSEIMRYAWKLYKQPYQKVWSPKKFAMCLRQSWQFHKERAFAAKFPVRAELQRRIQTLETRNRWNRAEHQAYTRLQGELHRQERTSFPAESSSASAEARRA